MFVLSVVLVLVASAIPVLAAPNDLPTKPEPQPSAIAGSVAPVPAFRENRFYDPFAKVEVGVDITAATFDTVQTCHNLANGGHEDVLPTQSCAGVATILFAQVAAQEGVAYILHRTHHDGLAHAIRAYSVAMNVDGIIYSRQHGAW